MKCNTTVNKICGVSFLKVPVHISVNKTEDDSLVSYKRLVMALCVTDGLLIIATVCKFPEEVTWFPVLICVLLNIFNPKIWNTHSHTVVKSYTAILKLGCKTWHTAHLLCNGYCVWLNLMNQLVCQSEVTDGIAVLIDVIVISVTAERLTETMAQIEH